MVIGCWLLVVGCWLLVVGCWLLVVGYGLLPTHKDNNIIFNIYQENTTVIVPPLGAVYLNFSEHSLIKRTDTMALRSPQNSNTSYFLPT